MQCETVRAYLVDRLSGGEALQAGLKVGLDGSESAPDPESAAIEEHLAGCAACRAQADNLADMWRMLGAIDSPPPDSARMRARLDGMVEGFEHGRGTGSPGFRGRLAAMFNRRWGPQLARAAAGFALVAIGVGIGVGIGTAIGRQTTTPAPSSASSRSDFAKASSDNELVAMRGELHDLREMVSLSLMQQQSASERLKGVSWSGQIDRPSSEIVAALLDTLMHDPNVNVRLATVDALERFAARDDVRRGAIQAVDRQMSPFVQIALIDFMVKVRERESIGTLRRLSQDPQVNAAVRARAAWGLQQLG